MKTKQKTCKWALLSILMFPIAIGSIISLFLSPPPEYILSILFGIVPIFSVLAVGFGLIAVGKISKNPDLKGQWLALIGIILGVLLIFSLTFMFMFGISIS